MFDGHNDYPWEVREKAGKDPAKLDIRGRQPATMTDIPRLRQGGVGAQFWSVYVPASARRASGPSPPRSSRSTSSTG